MNRRAVVICVCTALVASLFLPAPSIQAQGAAPTSLTLVATIRDFKEDHPDFEGTTGSEKGIVAKTLGTDGKPVYGTGYTTSGAANFNQWFNDTPGVNQASSLTLTLEQVAGTNKYSYNNQAFFPIDNLYWGNEGREHNFWFTTEVHTRFSYEGGETFSFTGDDDLFVFVNKKLALDLGGVHPAESGSFSLDALAGQLGIIKGKSYNLDIFHAERHWNASTFAIETSIELRPRAKISSTKFTFDARIEKARSELATKVNSLASERDALESEIKLDEGRIDEARANHLANISRMADIRSEMGQLQLRDGLSKSEKASLDELQTELASLDLDDRRLRSELEYALQALRDRRVRREDIDWQLFGIVRDRKALDFQLNGLTVTSDLAEVYKVRLKSPYAELQKLNGHIRYVTEKVAQLEALKKEALADFSSAQKVAIQRLNEIASGTIRDAKRKIAFDIAAALVDLYGIVIKGGSRLADAASGVIAEGLQRFVAFGIGYILEKSGVGEYIESRFEKNVKLAGGKNGTRAVVERTIKETVVKSLKDPLKGELCDFLQENFTCPIPPIPLDPPSDAQRIRSGVEKIFKGAKALENTLSEKFPNLARVAGFMKDLGPKIVRDAARVIFKEALDILDKERVDAFMAADLFAKTQHGWYLTMWEAHAEAEKQLQNLLALEAKLLSEWDPNTGQLTDMQKDFAVPEGYLTISLDIPESLSPVIDLPLKVFVGGKEADRYGATEFRILGSDLPQAELGQLKIEVK